MKDKYIIYIAVLTQKRGKDRYEKSKGRGNKE
jgi:hypothetical protein